ncbi:MAG: hypothetical protein GYA51_05710, partial [Candidatus Methanofastidiosa archaeon]|nr:hypothetical protein [Candidatus Methanofastidiosa archaeon]
ITTINQYASNVSPIPSYEIHPTDELEGKIFILIRIFEGDRTPYYVQNDSNIWVRTGDMNNPIDIASPDALEILFKKKEKAEKARSIYKDRAYEIYYAALKRAEKQRLFTLAQEKREFEKEQQAAGVSTIDDSKFQPKTITNELGSNTSMCTILLQPYFPSISFCSAIEIRNKLSGIKINRVGYIYPKDYSIEMTPSGTLFFNWRKTDGYLECEELFGNGLIFNSRDILSNSIEYGKRIFLVEITYFLYFTLLGIRNFYEFIGYQGTVIGSLNINDVEDVMVIPIIPRGWSDYGDRNSCLLSRYDWEIDLETSIINDDQMLKNFVVSFLNQMYISFNYSPPQPKLFDAFFKEIGVS